MAQTWDGEGGNNDFGTGLNWVGNATPGVGSGIVLSFTGPARPNPNNNYTTGDNFGEWRLKFDATVDFTFTGNLFGLFGKIENEAGSGNLFTIDTSGIVARDGSIEINPVGGNIVTGSGTGIFLDGNAGLNVYDGGLGNTLSILGSLDNGNGTGGNGSLILNQTSTVVLSGTNDYGSTILNSGTTLRIGAGGTSGTLGTGGVANDGTLIFNRSDNFSAENAITGSGAVTKEGGGTVTLTSTANAYSGNTSIIGGTLLIGAGGVIPNTSNVTINGGTLGMGGAFTEAAGTLSLGNAGANVIDVNETGSFSFAASNLASWTGTLSIWNWSQGVTQVSFGSDGNGLTGTQLSQITVYDGPGSNNLGSFTLNNAGQLVPVPEPGALFAGLALLAPLAWRERRHWMRCGAAR